jgi:hypothetical protein
VCDGLVFVEVAECLLEGMWLRWRIDFVDGTEVLGADLVDDIGTVGLVTITAAFEEA